MTRQQLIEDACLPFADQSLHHTHKKRRKTSYLTRDLGVLTTQLSIILRDTKVV
jgi:hypothetical protein